MGGLLLTVAGEFDRRDCGICRLEASSANKSSVTAQCLRTAPQTLESKTVCVAITEKLLSI